LDASPKIKWGDERIIWGKDSGDRLESSYFSSDGRSCMFHATQAAYAHFMGGGFGVEEFRRFETGVDQLRRSERERLELPGEEPQWTGVSLLFLTNYLREKFVDVTGIYMHPVNVERLRKIEDTASLPLVAAAERTVFKPPLIGVILYETGELHAVFNGTKEEWNGTVKDESEKGGQVVAVLMVEKAKQQ
jgi:hypothetical protein